MEGNHRFHQAQHRTVQGGESFDRSFNSGGYPRMPKVDFPGFDGTKPRSWIRKCNRYFSLFAVQDSQRVELAGMYVTGRADTWLQGYMLQNSDRSWEELCEVLCARFGEGCQVDVVEDFKKLEQRGELEAYNEKFEDWCDDDCADSFSCEALELQQPAIGKDGEDYSKVNYKPLDDSMSKGNLVDQFDNGQQLGDKLIVNVFEPTLNFAVFEQTSESFANVVEARKNWCYDVKKNWCYDVKKNSTGCWSIDGAHQLLDIMPSRDCSLLSTLVDKRIALGCDMELITLDLPYDRGKSNHMHGHNKGSKFWKDRIAVFDPGGVAKWDFHVVLDHWCCASIAHISTEDWSLLNWSLDWYLIGVDYKYWVIEVTNPPILCYWTD